MKTVTGLFDTYLEASSAVAALRHAGISHGDISILSRDAQHIELQHDATAEGASVGSGVGFLAGGAGGLLAGLGLVAIPGLGPVIAAGWLASLIAGAAAGTVVGGAAGGLIGAFSGSNVAEDDAHVMAESLKRGGTLVTVRVPVARAAEVEAILAAHSSVDLNERRKEFEEGGWQGYSPDAMR